MTADLFSEGSQRQRLLMAGADVDYFRHMPLNGLPPTDVLLQHLIADIPWRQESVVVWGKSHPQPRLIAWFGDVGKSYSYSGIDLVPLEWTPLLLQLKDRVESVTHAVFNSVLLNYYRNHRDSMGFHSDDEPELGKRPTIASLSLGAPRTFVFKHKSDKVLKPVRIKLEDGSLLLMAGETQRNWKHGIEKEARPCGPRVNLTFRTIRASHGLQKERTLTETV